MAAESPPDRGMPPGLRLSQRPGFRSFFLAVAMVASALGIPIRFEPPPKPRVPAEVVRGEGDEP
jgi:predicted MFS family arabinose efflux permease